MCAPGGHNRQLALRADGVYWRGLISLFAYRVTMAGTDKRKQSLYFPEDMLREIQDEAARQDRSLSGIVKQAWKIARSDFPRFRSVNDVLNGETAADDPKGRAE